MHVKWILDKSRMQIFHHKGKDALISICLLFQINMILHQSWAKWEQEMKPMHESGKRNRTSGHVFWSCISIGPHNPCRDVAFITCRSILCQSKV